MKSFYSASLLVSLSALVGAVDAHPVKEVVEHVSMIQLIANPERYKGKLVAVGGFVNLEFESNGIFLHKEDYEQGIRANGLWLNAAECTRPDGAKFSTGYALVIARFTRAPSGRVGGLWGGEWPGSLDPVRECVSYPSRRPAPN